MLKVSTFRAYSALSKRTNKVKVQLLKDFPQFQLYKGQVTQVSPSLMRNYLHLSNGARYILKEQDIDENLHAQSITEAATRAKVVQKAVKEQIQKAAEKIPQEPVAVAKETPKVFNSGVTVSDVKIPGLEI